MLTTNQEGHSNKETFNLQNTWTVAEQLVEKDSGLQPDTGYEVMYYIYILYYLLLDCNVISCNS